MWLFVDPIDKSHIQPCWLLDGLQQVLAAEVGAKDVGDFERAVFALVPVRHGFYSPFAFAIALSAASTTSARSTAEPP